jgi:hypothetical protein
MDSLKGLILLVIAAFLFGLFLLFFTAIAKADTNTIVHYEDLDGYDLEETSFEVSHPLTIRIEAVGAGNRKTDELYAYGWIFNNDTRRPEWIMEYERTERFDRGGDLREFTGEVDLDPGNYTAYFYSGGPFGFITSISIDGLEDFTSWLDETLSGKHADADEFRFVITSESDDFEIVSRPRNGEDNAVVQLSAYDDDYYESEGFTLERDVTLEIYALGEYSKSDRIMVDYGWIIDAGTREKVWVMERWNTDPAGGASKNRAANESIELPAGNYVAYYATDDSHSPESWNTPPPYDPYSWGMTILVQDPAMMAYVKPFKDDQDAREVLALTRVGDSEYESEYFSVSRPVTLHIYAIGEFDRFGDEFADYGWIEDLNSLDRVWEMTRRNTEHAGGAVKNRRFQGNVSFEPGDYVVHYVTDGSHAYRDWNASPPIDQRRYGITLYALNDDDMKLITVSDQPPRDGNTLVNISAVGSYEEESQPFVLDKRARIHVLAVGEGVSGKMYDYAWIEDAETGRIVWEMEYRDTDHAGGANKNRVFDDVIELAKGSYEAYYITDDSHAFGDWNSAKPYDPTRWGIMITLAD